MGVGGTATTARGGYDVVVVGGGIAGSVLAGVLARAGVRVLVAEKEPRFRDRVRGEAMLPWGVAEAHRLGIEPLFELAGGVELVGMGFYDGGMPGAAHRWAIDTQSVGGHCEMGFSHPRMQEAAFAWAQSQGATVRRPVKVTDFSRNGVATVTMTQGAEVEEVRARLVVGADGKMSSVRRWTGGEGAADPEHHRFGGVAVSGVSSDDRETDNVAGDWGFGVNWFAQGADTTRLYVMMTNEELHKRQIDRSFDALVGFAAGHMPQGSLDQVRQEGPIAFFSNHDTWATQVAGCDVVLIGDAAGSVDPTQGHGTSLAIRDVRELSDLLLADDDWAAAIRDFAERRMTYFNVLHQWDLWRNMLDMEAGEEADRLRDGVKGAQEVDPSLGGFALIEGRGPDGLPVDPAGRAMYFGTTLT